jgi:hypothetical protein
MNGIAWAFLLAVVALAFVWFVMRNKPASNAVANPRAFTPAMEALIDAARVGWIEMRSQRTVHNSEELADQMEIHAQSFAAWAALKSGSNELPPADRVWMIVLEAVRRSGTETPEQFANAVQLVQARNTGSTNG